MAPMTDEQYEQLISKAQDLLVLDEPTQDELEEAERYIDEALTDDPEDSNALCLKIMALREQDRIDDALHWVEKAEPFCDDNAFYTEKAMVMMEKAEEYLYDCIEACEHAIDRAEDEMRRDEIDEADTLEFILCATAHMMLAMNEDDGDNHADDAEEVLLQGLDSSSNQEFREAIKEQLDEFGFEVL